MQIPRLSGLIDQTRTGFAQSVGADMSNLIDHHGNKPSWNKAK
jgi:arginine/ornithine N-succinyltransferase beta subunit